MLFQAKPVAADEATFERHITRNDIPVLVDIWASWCQPYLAMAPAYERAAAELEPNFRLLKVNADEAQQLGRANVRSIGHAPDYQMGKTQCGTILTAIKAGTS